MLCRERQLSDIIKFITESEAQVERILRQLEWNKSETIKCCNANNTKNFKSSCGDDTANDPSYPPAYPWEHAFTFDKSTLNGLIKSETPKEVPNKFSETQVNFNREEKLLMYEHVIKKTGRLLEPEISITYNQEEGIQKKMTFAEVVALKRDLKRRRMKHRTTKLPPLSYTEEVRNLIDVQMQALMQYLHPEKGDEGDDYPSDWDKSGSSGLKSGKDTEETFEEHRKSRHKTRSRGREKQYKRKDRKDKHRRSPSANSYELMNYKHAKRAKKYKSREYDTGVY